MKLGAKDVEKRIRTKLNRSITSKSDNINGYMMFGENNDYPQIIEMIIQGSISAKAVSDIYAKFLTGSGFTDKTINDTVIGSDERGKNITCLSLLRDCARSLSKNNGCYVHRNNDLNGVTGNAKLIPFKNCRFSKPDDAGFIAKIGVHPNWTKDGDLNTVKLFKAEDIQWYPIFNSNIKAIESQVVAAGGIEKTKGQIYFLFLDNEFIYPLSPFDPVYLDCDTENELAKFKNNTTRNGMLQKVVLRLVEPTDDQDKKDLEAEITDWVGVDGKTSLVIYDELDPVTGDIKKSGAFAVDSIPTNINDKLFENWQEGISNNIRKANKAIPKMFLDFDSGNFSGASGESIKQAVSFYNIMTQDDRAAISEMFKDIFQTHEKLKNITDWSIDPLNIQSDATTIVNAGKPAINQTNQ